MSNTIMLGDKSTKYKLGDSNVKAVYLGDTKVWSSGLSKAVSYTKNTNPIAWDTGTYLRSIKVNNLKDSRNLILTQSATLSSSGAAPKVYEFNIDTLSVGLNASNLSSLYTHTIEAVQLNVDGTWYVVGTVGDYIRFFQGSTQKNQTYDSSIKEFKPIIVGDTCYFWTTSSDSKPMITSYDFITDTFATVTSSYDSLSANTSRPLYYVDGKLYTIDADYNTEGITVYRCDLTALTLVKTTTGLSNYLTFYNALCSYRGIGSNQSTLLDGSVYYVGYNTGYKIDLGSGEVESIDMSAISETVNMAGDKSEYMFGNSVFYMCDSGGTGKPPMHKLTLE